MFGKKKKEEQKPADKVEVLNEKPSVPTPKDVVKGQIEQLAPGQTLKYKVPQAWGGDFIDICLNPTYPEKPKSKKYNLCVEGVVEGKPNGKITILGDSNDAKYLASWVSDRKGEFFTKIE